MELSLQAFQFHAYFRYSLSTICLALNALYKHLLLSLRTICFFFVTRFPLYRRAVLIARAANIHEAPIGLENAVAFMDTNIIQLIVRGKIFSALYTQEKQKRTP